MLSLRIAGGVRLLADRYKDLAPGMSHHVLCCFLTMYLFRCPSLSQVARITGWTESVSSLSRHAQRFKANRFMRRLRASILRRYDIAAAPEDYCLIVDDTDNPKSSMKAYYSGLWRSSKGVYWGQRITVLALLHIPTDTAIPLSYRLGQKGTDPQVQSGIDCVSDMVEEALSEGFPKIRLVADSWFDATKLIARMTELGLPFHWELKSNRRVRTNASPNVPWVRLNDVFDKSLDRQSTAGLLYNRKTVKWVSTTKLQLKTYKTPINAIAVYNRKNGKEPFAYYASTDRRVSWQRIWELSRARWRIECLFRDLKQNLCFGRFATITECGTHLAVCLPLILITSLRLDSDAWGVTETDTIGQKLSTIYERELNRSISLLVDRPNDATVVKFRNRRAKHRQKPVDHAAEVPSTGQCLAG